MAREHDIIVKPLLTEKGMANMESTNAYPFMVADEANKCEIKRAVEKLFNVRVKRVRTLTQPGKKRRKRLWTFGKTPGWKKAIVQLHPDDHLDFI